MAEIFQRLGDLKSVRSYLKEATYMCPENLRWKIWMMGSRIEAHLGEAKSAENLVLQCVKEIPEKQ
jgi:hypothetical protein